MKRNKLIKIFENEGLIILTCLIICVLFSLIRFLRFRTQLGEFSILDAVVFADGHIITQAGGIFDNSILIIYFASISVLSASILGGRFTSSKGYYFIRCGIKKYFLENMFLEFTLVLIIVIIQTVVLIFSFALEGEFDHTFSEVGAFVYYLLLYIIILLFHVFCSCLIGILVNMYLQFFSVFLLVTAEVLYISVKNGKAAVYCPLSLINYTGFRENGSKLPLVILISAFAGVCFLISHIIKKRNFC